MNPLTDAWQARALAAEAHASRLADALADEVAGRVAAEADVARLREALRSTCDRCKAHAAIERLVPELDAMPERLPRLVGKPHPAEVDARCEEHYALYTPTPPAAVAALVRAARAVIGHRQTSAKHIHHDRESGCGSCMHVDDLSALLDAPPWRALR